MTRQRVAERSADVLRCSPLLALAIPHIAHAAIRNQGTVGGSIAHADPAAEIPLVALAVDAVMVVRGPSGIRTIAADRFFTGPMTNAMTDDEVMIEVRFPEHDPRCTVAFDEVSRRHGDPALPPSP